MLAPQHRVRTRIPVAAGLAHRFARSGLFLGFARSGLFLGFARSGLFLGFALLACATTIHVVVDVDPDADFASLQSYAWISADPLIPQVNGVTQGGPPISPIDDKRIRTAVDNQLGAKGWQRVVERDEADLVVSYGVGATEKTKVYETPTALGYYGSHGYRYGTWYGGSTMHTKQYTEGTLTVEFFNRRTKQAVWVGWASKRLYRSEDRQDVVERAVEKILRDFPSRP